MRILRYLWFNLVMSLTGWMPDLKHVMRFRGFLSRPAFKTCGKNFQIGRRVIVNFPNRVDIGRDVYIATGCWLQGMGGLIIEDEVQLAPYVVIATRTHKILAGSYRFGVPAGAEIRLCRGSWIASHATVCKGVTVGQGALVAANSLVSTNVPELSIVCGVPAQVLKQH